MVVLVVVGGIALSAAWERDWRVAGGIARRRWSRCAAWRSSRPRGHDVGPLRVAIVQGGGPQRTRAADTDAREVFERHLAGQRAVNQPVDLVLWPENVVGARRAA